MEMADLHRKPPFHQGHRQPDVEKGFRPRLVEPADDWRDDTQASIPELLVHLEKLMIRLDYDLRGFKRTSQRQGIWREATDYELANDQPYYFEGPILTRMSAERLWDSFVSLSIPYADERVRDQKVIKEKLSRFTEYQKEMEGLEPKAMVRLASKGEESKQLLSKMDSIKGNSMRLKKPMIERPYPACSENIQRPATSKDPFAKLVMGDDDVLTLRRSVGQPFGPAMEGLQFKLDESLEIKLSASRTLSAGIRPVRPGNNRELEQAGIRSSSSHLA